MNSTNSFVLSSLSSSEALDMTLVRVFAKLLTAFPALEAVMDNKTKNIVLFVKS